MTDIKVGQVWEAKRKNGIHVVGIVRAPSAERLGAFEVIKAGQTSGVPKGMIREFTMTKFFEGFRLRGAS